MARDGKAFWYKNGKIIEVKNLHITDVCENHDIFGLSKEYIQSVYDLFGEPWGSEGRAREKIMIEVMKQGWIRIRQSIGREGSRWTIQFDDYEKRQKNIQEIVSRLLPDPIKDYDSLVLLQSDGGFYKIYDFWKNDTRPSDFLAEGMNKEKKMAKMIYSYDEFLN